MKRCIGILLFFLSTSFCYSEDRIVFVRASSNSENNGYEAYKALDGDANTMWHTQFSARSQKSQFPFPISCGYNYGCNDFHPMPTLTSKIGNNMPLPHFLLLDLGDPIEIKGFIYKARKNAENGAVKKYQIFVTNNENEQCSPVSEGEFAKTDVPQKIVFEKPAKGRFVKLVAITEHNGASHSSVAELTLLADGVKFAPEVGVSASQKKIPLEKGKYSQWLADIIEQYNILASEFDKPAYYQEIAKQVACQQSLILESDRDPVDVVLRRTFAIKSDPRLESIAQKNQETPISDAEARFALFVEVCKIRRELMLADPLLDFDKILLVKKHRATYEHLCDQFYGINSLPGGGLFVLDWKSGETKNILADAAVQNGRLKGKKLVYSSNHEISEYEHGKPATTGVYEAGGAAVHTDFGINGSFLSPDLSFDGDEITFAFVECNGSTEQSFHTDLSRGHWTAGRSFHIYSCKTDGSDLKMLTDGSWNDFDPCFLPNGRIAFISERRGGYLRCGRECPNYTLFDMNPDGSQIRCLSYHETNEWNPSVTNDGKIIWTRWDYVDRFGCIAHHPWVTSLDGLDPRAVHGNFSHRHLRADAEFDMRAIPNSPKYIGTAGPHHGQSFGSIILVDPHVPDDNAMSNVKRLTPDAGFPESQGGGQIYGTPFPLSESLFLAVADYGFQPNAGIQKNGYGLYLCDSHGNRELLYRDAEISCLTPIPLRARQKPPVVPGLIDVEEIKHQPFVALSEFDGERPEATITISDVYQSDRPIPDGTKIKELRVVQIYCMSVPSGWNPHEIGFREPSALDSVYLARGVLGTVPVEEDGSAHFKVPAQAEMYFQLLDESGLAVQTMRSATALHEGEILSCVGCHEPRTDAPKPINRHSKALLRSPSELKREMPGSRPISYPILVQPILDKHCADCHEKEKAINLSKHPIQKNWYASYNELVGKGYAFYDYGEPLRSNPSKFGAKSSKLYALLKDGKHYDVKLNTEEMRSLTLWMDLCSLFYGVYEKDGGLLQLRGEFASPTLE